VHPEHTVFPPWTHRPVDTIKNTFKTRVNACVKL
jgi:hypothetical protein